jgi:hypothetical protein
VSCNIAGHDAASRRMSDMYGITQIEMLDDGGGISGVTVHVVAFRHLARSTVTAAVESDNTVAMLDEK